MILICTKPTFVQHLYRIEEQLQPHKASKHANVCCLVITQFVHIVENRFSETPPAQVYEYCLNADVKGVKL